MTKLILTDVDETIMDFTTPFEAWLKARGWDVLMPMRDYYDITRILDTDLDTALKLVSEFHVSPEFGQLDPEPCAKAVLPELYRQGYRFVAITACLDTAEVRQARLDNLEAVFGFPWEDCHCTGMTHDKSAALASYGPAIWVEDNPKHASRGALEGHRTFIITRGYNTGYENPDVTRVSDWHEIAKHLES